MNLVALSLLDGQKLWEYDLGTDNYLEKAFALSSIYVQPYVYIANNGILDLTSLDPATGKVRWQLHLQNQRPEIGNSNLQYPSTNNNNVWRFGITVIEPATTKG